MAKFNYKFKTIKKVKEQIEKKHQKELAICDLEIKRIENYLIELKDSIINEKARLLINNQIKISDAHFFSKYENFVNGKLKAAEKELSAKKKERIKKMKILVEMSKETKILEKLEEKHKVEFFKEQERLEQIDLDEIAVTSFNKDK